MLIDTHCHLHDREFFTEEQAEEMIKRAHENGVKKIICIGTSHEDSLTARDFAEAHENVFWTYGIHPENASEACFSRSASLRPVGTGEARSSSPCQAPDLLEKHVSDALVGIGEVGLDYHYDGYDRDAQIKLFREMLQLAKDNDLPVSFHVREAFDDFFEIVKDYPEVRGVVHSFTDSKKTLKRILNETDYYIGVNGLATYSTLPTPPLERILLETDAPFLTPEPFRGIINECAYVRNVAKWLSVKLGVSIDIIEKETTQNGERLYRI